jgi:hypothetical protein
MSKALHLRLRAFDNLTSCLLVGLGFDRQGFLTTPLHRSGAPKLRQDITGFPSVVAFV